MGENLIILVCLEEQGDTDGSRLDDVACFAIQATSAGPRCASVCRSARDNDDDHDDRDDKLQEEEVPPRTMMTCCLAALGQLLCQYTLLSGETLWGREVM
ncbi:hypothetical protein PoB_003185800 [Plakobranchus ocellatus]|uniref:Uncharacterized protein n=1 Tax=Plakobranchus ocellatus TaxID=259542 RepID=A0AAV4AFM4_9GAST|nr:hypothetical protein PoB_003185800 [Plakobranchus ocellatus]